MLTENAYFNLDKDFIKNELLKFFKTIENDNILLTNIVGHGDFLHTDFCEFKVINVYHEFIDDLNERHYYNYTLECNHNKQIYHIDVCFSYLVSLEIFNPYTIDKIFKI